MNGQVLVYGVSAVVCAFLLSYLLTPAVRALAYKLGAVDLPKDGRRMHDRSIPLIGGLAVFISFSVTTFLFAEIDSEIYAIWTGGTILIILGILDDIFDLGPWIKLAVQVAAAVCAIYQGVVIREVYIFSRYVDLGRLSAPVTILWIVVLVNAFNLIDGLDGLSSGVCAISCVSLAFVAILYGNVQSALVAAVLFGACTGFLPYNFFPARIFIGNTGAYFLGFVLAVISINGVFKISAVISFLLPVLIFALPLIDTIFAFFRRIAHGQAPFTADKKHLHHRLIELGLSQRHAVFVMYAVSGLFGLLAVIFTDRILPTERTLKSLFLLAVIFMICAVDFLILRHNKMLRDKRQDKNEDNNGRTGM